MELERRLAKAKTRLILDHPFFGNLAMNMPFTLDDTIPTACTNGKYVKFNPEFIKPLNDDELLFLVTHEVMHPVLEHNYRRNHRDPMKWNIAGDAVINPMIEDEGIGTFIKGGVMDRDLLEKGGGTTDGVYNLLPDQPEGGDGRMGDIGIPYDDCQDADGNSPAEISQQQAQMRVKVAQAAQSAKMMGKLSANMERVVGDLLQSKVPWSDVMNRFYIKAKTDDRTFARANRRLAQQGIYLPSNSGEVMGEVVKAIDCSGSIGDDQIAQFNTESVKMWQDLRPTKMHIIYFDSEVCHYDCFEDEEPVIKPHGGGGTAFSPIFKFIEEKGIDPVACVVLTDLYCDDFGNEPHYPVLWVSTHKDEAPWGEVVMMEGASD